MTRDLSQSPPDASSRRLGVLMRDAAARARQYRLGIPNAAAAPAIGRLAGAERYFGPFSLPVDGVERMRAGCARGRKEGPAKCRSGDRQSCCYAPGSGGFTSLSSSGPCPSDRRPRRLRFVGVGGTCGRRPSSGPRAPAVGDTWAPLPSLLRSEQNSRPADSTVLGSFLSRQAASLTARLTGRTRLILGPGGVT
jgi:hypothetical protein